MKTIFLTAQIVLLCSLAGHGYAQSAGMSMGYGGEASGGYGNAGHLRIRFAVVESTDRDGEVQSVNRVALRLKKYRYTIGSFKPKVFADFTSGGMGGMMGGGYGGDTYGGMGGPGMGGGGDMGGGGMDGGPSRERSLEIHAYFIEESTPESLAEIELFTPQFDGGGGGGMGASMGMAGGYGGGGYGAEAGGGEYGMEEVATVRPLAALAKPEKGGKSSSLTIPAQELKIVSDIIRQELWREDMVALINQSKKDELDKIELLLKQVLTEQYDTQLVRQEMEIQQIESRVEQLREELQRRQVAKERVVDVQLGRIVLEAQGLLGR